jgi:hypothetical protein
LYFVNVCIHESLVRRLYDGLGKLVTEYV